jgi:hypothetical protein
MSQFAIPCSSLPPILGTVELPLPNIVSQIALPRYLSTQTRVYQNLASNE